MAIHEETSSAAVFFTRLPGEESTGRCGRPNREEVLAHRDQMTAFGGAAGYWEDDGA